MSADSKKNPLASEAIAEAIRAKRDGYQRQDRDWGALADELLHEIESFDIDVVEQEIESRAAPQPLAPAEPARVYPDIVAEGVRHHVPQAKRFPEPSQSKERAFGGSSFLGNLRAQALERQRQLHQELAARTAASETIDSGLRQVFSYLHELVQQLNILRPPVAHSYSVLDQAMLEGLSWQEGFVDFRTQSQAAGAFLELVTFSYQLAAPRKLTVSREGPAIERFRQALFDYGLRFQCNEVRNQRRHLLRGDFEINAELSVNVRWRAEYARGLVIIETRNLERLGSFSYAVAPENIGQELLDEFGRLLLGEASRFREFCRR